MEAQVTPKGIVVKVEGDTAKSLFRAVAAVDEIFRREPCGLCGNPETRFVHRNVTKGKQSFDYYEKRCDACGGRLYMGQQQDGVSLFPKRKLDADGRPDMEGGKFGKHNGWTKFSGDKTEGD